MYAAPRIALLCLAALVPAAASASRPIRRVATGRPLVALTFDACATRNHAYSFDRELFAILQRQRIPVTVFVAGRWLETHPDEARALAAEDFVEFGNHSYDHQHFPRLRVRKIHQEIDLTEALLGRLGRRSVAFRPPYGDWNRHVVDVVRRKGIPFVTWDVVSRDPSRRTSARAMVRSVLGHARAGSIVVFHINGRGAHTAQALPAILDGLRARGLGFVRLSELLGAK